MELDGQYGDTLIVGDEFDADGELRVDDEDVRVALTPATARAFGAGLIEAADEAEGVETLLFAVPDDAREAGA